MDLRPKKGFQLPLDDLDKLVLVVVNQAIDQHHGQTVGDDPIEGNDPLLQAFVKIPLILLMKLGPAQVHQGIADQVVTKFPIDENR